MKGTVIAPRLLIRSALIGHARSCLILPLQQQTQQMQRRGISSTMGSVRARRGTHRLSTLPLTGRLIPGEQREMKTELDPQFLVDLNSLPTKLALAQSKLDLLDVFSEKAIGADEFSNFATFKQYREGKKVTGLASDGKSESMTERPRVRLTPGIPEEMNQRIQLLEKKRHGYFLKRSRILSQLHDPKSASVQEKILQAAKNAYIIKIIEVRMGSTMRKGGRQQSQRCMAVTGNRNGIVGVNFARAITPKNAINKAVYSAPRYVVPVPRFNGHTIYQELRAKVGKTTLIMRPLPEGFGLRCNRYTALLCRLAGIDDLNCTILGPINKANIAKATIKALQSQKTIRDIAAETGRNVVELKRRENTTREEVV